MCPFNVRIFSHSSAPRSAGGGAVDDPERQRRIKGRDGNNREHVGQQPDAEGCKLADASIPRSQGGEQPGSPGERHWPQAHGPASERGGAWLHPPGPSDADAWAAILAMAPHLAPSVAFGDIAHRAGLLAQMVAEGELAEEAAETAWNGTRPKHESFNACFKSRANGE